MKARLDSGKVVKYSKIPSEWNGTRHYIGGFHNATTEELEAEGFFDVVTPAIRESQELGAIAWDSSNSVFTYPVENKTFSQSLAEMKAQKIDNLKSIYGRELAKTDWIVVRDQELGDTTDSAISSARATLRSACATKETAINGKTTKAQVADYSLPNFR